MSELGKKIVRYGTIAVGFVLAVLFIIQGIGAYQDYTLRMAQCDQDIASYQKSLLTGTAELEELEAQLDSMEARLNNMTEEGNRVAQLQNEYSRLIYDGSNGSSIVDVRDALSVYFPFDSVDSWYVWNRSDLKSCSWSCVTSYNIEEDIIDALWVCSNGKSVCAYASAVFDASTRCFSDLSVHVTPYGQYYAFGEGTQE